ncbi:Protein of unknown function DUF1218 [Macleaya cordata]|uniref:Uncharacterized protein n=1 Tax=Macleaya cordata TaxID=56857 RepID=A0A200QMG0_MACCD|nr:Protein of unknown function DUF1218 [Macleaya cordata]
MGKAIAALICLLIVSMDIVAGVLGIQAEIAQNKVKHLKLWIFECREPSQDAFKLGLAAASILALAHVIAILLGGKFGRDFGSPSTTVLDPILSGKDSLKRIVLAVGFSTLIIGTLANSKSRSSCGISHNKFLSIGGILCFVHGLFCVSYYVSANAAAEDAKKSNHSGRNGSNA